jgi:TonB family protein
MKELLLYIARSGLYLGIFYAFYLLVMRRMTFFRLNRAILLLGSLACALLPFLKIRTANHMVGAGPLSMIAAEDSSTLAVQGAGFSWPATLSFVYLLGVLAVILITAVSTERMFKLLNAGEKRLVDGCHTAVLDNDHPSFSFGQTIVIGRKDLEENPAIFMHEKMHVKCRHYLDLFVFRAIQTVWWWNPLVWLVRTELGLLHEYEADEAVIKQGIDATQYQLLLVRKAVGEQRFSLASGFQHAKLKNRISMMLKPSSNGWMRLSYLALIPLMALVAYACNPAKNNKGASGTNDAEDTYRVIVTDEPQAEDSIPFQMVEVKPTFKSGDANEFAKWVNDHLNYPEEAKKAGIQGRLVMSFVVDTDGSVKDVKILRGVDPLLDAEALRVLNGCTEKWAPGMQDGQPVKVTYTLPIIFQLK